MSNHYCNQQLQRYVKEELKTFVTSPGIVTGALEIDEPVVLALMQLLLPHHPSTWNNVHILMRVIPRITDEQVMDLPLTEHQVFGLLTEHLFASGSSPSDLYK